MAIVGCSYVKGGIYNNNNGTVTYSNQTVIAKLVHMQLSLDDQDDNDFNADNTVDETDSQFGGGTYELKTNDLTDEMSALILGLQTNTLTGITGVTDVGVKEVIFDERQNTPYMGIGNVVKHKRGGTYFYINTSKTEQRSGKHMRINDENRSLDVVMRELVQEPTISPELLGAWLQNAGKLYRIKKLAMDSYRWTLVSDAMIKAGFDARDKQKVKLIRPSDIMKVEPLIASIFDRGLYVWGDYPPLRWATNNTKRIPASRGIGSDTGNFYYGKIEAKSRKTDPFMALVAAECVEDALPANSGPLRPPPPPIVWR